MIQDILVQAETLYQIAKKHRQEALEPHGLNHKKYRILSYIYQQGTCNPSMLSDALIYDRPTTTILLKKLEHDGWIKRQVNPLNRRYVQVSLTEMGVEKVLPILTQCENLEIFDEVLPQEALETLSELMGKLIEQSKK